MKYEQYDKLYPQADEREKIIIKSLCSTPMQIIEIVKQTNLKYHQVQSCLLRMRRKLGIVTKKRFEEKTYYGLVKKLRNS